ncbi:glycerophosphodiester phosphodiesterase [Jeotgalibacillus proteolyticus]|uniref:glycerophosphodiester phosphodiesterase n=1 Tax=Jeotgalibacillus proteolyticus TaxID=2082395 RepID=UPI003CED1B3C
MSQIFAHRGASGLYPENTMKAFKEAEKSGCDGIELDVQRTKDGHLVVIHDETVNRTTNGKGIVASLTLKQIRALDASYNKKKWFSNNKVPTLDEVLDWLGGNPLLCNIELKNDKVDYKGMEEEVLQKVAEYNLDDRIIYSSFNLQSIIRLRELDASVSIAPIYSKKGVNPSLLASSLSANAIHANHRVMTPALMDACQRMNIPVRLYTLNDPAKLKMWIGAGLGGVITDFPDRAVKVRESLQRNDS